MDRDRWLAALATVLGISVDACAREAEPSAVPVTAYEVPSASPSGSPMTITSATASPTSIAAPSAPPIAEASCASIPTPGEKSCGAGTCSGAKSCAAAVAPPPPPPSSVPDSARVIAALQPRLRACYQKQLAANPTLEGGVTMTIDVAADGSVTSVTPGQTKLPPALVACLAGVIQRVSFSAPTNGATRFSVPLRFTK
jgi:hypothetical protein